MTVRKWKFMDTLSAGLITPVYNAALVAGDAAADYFGKLQGLLNTRKLRSVLTATVSGGASSTADVTLMTLTIPGNQQLPADAYRFEIRGTWNHPNSGGSTISFWIKVDATKIGVVTITPAATVTTRPFCYQGTIICQSNGSSGVIIGSGDVFVHLNATNTIVSVGAPTTATQNTTSSYNITLGINFSNSNASNLVSALMGEIHQI